MYGQCTTSIKNNASGEILYLDSNGEQFFDFTPNTSYTVTAQNQSGSNEYSNLCRLSLSYRNIINTHYDNRQIGSFRIKRITNDSGISEGKIVKEYEYKLDDGITSSGTMMDPPLANHRQDYFFNKSGNTIFKCTYDAYYSSSYNPENTNFGKSVGYKKVTEKQTDNNGIIKKDLYYSIGYQNVDDINLLMLTPRSDQNYKNGLIEKEIIYKGGDSIMVKKFEYDFDTHFNQESMDSNITSGGGPEAISYGMITKVDELCGNTSPDASYLYQHYPIFSSWVKPVKQISTLYVNGLPMETKTTETYRSDYIHINPEKEIIKYPDNSVQESQYQYAQDLNVSDLIDANMLKIPLQMEVKLKRDPNSIGTVKSKTKINYVKNAATNNLILPVSVLSQNLQTTTMETEVTYNQYDSKGNLQQYTTKEGVSTAIIWGYNNTQPIAKVEGATYAQVSPYITDIVSASDADASAAPGNDENALLNMLNTFRKRGELSNFQITTYTYDPLIGVRTITPSSGIREYYNYDTAHRLKEVKDINGNILKSYEYHYKP